MVVSVMACTLTFWLIFGRRCQLYLLFFLCRPDGGLTESRCRIQKYLLPGPVCISSVDEFGEIWKNTCYQFRSVLSRRCVGRGPKFWWVDDACKILDFVFCFFFSRSSSSLATSLVAPLPKKFFNLKAYVRSRRDENFIPSVSSSASELPRSHFRLSLENFVNLAKEFRL